MWCKLTYFPIPNSGFQIEKYTMVFSSIKQYKEKAFSYSLSIKLAAGFCKMFLIKMRNLPSTPRFLEIVFIKDAEFCQMHFFCIFCW